MDIQPFTDWLATVFGLALALAGIVSALIAAIKTGMGESLPARYYPVLAVAVGVLLAMVVALVLPADLRLTLGFTLRLALFVGGIAGLMAAGLFAYGKGKEVVGP